MAASSRRCYCSVPRCSTSKQRQPYLSFHDFPKDEHLRNAWVRLIRRDEGPLFNISRGSTFVCSLHFDKDSIYVSKSGRKLLKTGTTPSRFSWNNWGETPLPRQSVFDRVNARLGVEEIQCSNAEEVEEQQPATVAEDQEPAARDHSYARNSADGLDAAAAAETIRQLEAKVRSLE